MAIGEAVFGAWLTESVFEVWLTKIAFGVWLAALAAEDFKNKSVKTWHIAAMLLPGILYAALYRYGGEESSLTILLFLLADLVPGLILCLLSKLTRRGIGMGDALVTMVIGIYMGTRFAFICLCAAFFLASPAALLLYCLKKKQKTARIPFLPFLFAGYIMAFFI